MDKNQILITDLLIIVGLALVTNCFSELVSYIFIYRKKQYKELTKNIQSETKKIELIKDSLSLNARQSDKKLKNMESELKNLNFQMTKLRMGSTFIVGLLLIFIMSTFSSIYQVRINFILGYYSCKIAI